MTPSDKHYLDRAALLALRAAGDVEPNPLVGAVLVRNGQVIGVGHHRRFGEAHAEVEAIADCRRRGESPAGATLYVTLEPCNHVGKQPACTRAIIEAGIARVVAARRDPNAIAAGGAEALQHAGIPVEFTRVSTLATSIGAPFTRRVTTGLPWVIAKWAQTIDGRVATRAGESKWISCETSRQRVHRLRARVDAILTAIGTVRADDPRLTARGVARVRRVARRIVIDPRVEVSQDSALVRTINEAPLTIVYDESQGAARAGAIDALAARGVELHPAPADGAGRIQDLRTVLRTLVGAHNLTNVLVEAGPRLLGSLVREDLVDEAHVYIAPMLLADEAAMPAASGMVAPRMVDAARFMLCSTRRVGVDALLVYRRKE